MCNSRSVKDPEWHLKKMVDHFEKVRSHGFEIPWFKGSDTQQQIETIYLALNEAHLRELKRKNGV